MEVPDMDALQRFMETEEAAGAMQHDGVRPDTVLFLDEASGQM